MFARARARLGREGTGVYGFRITAPHHDGTPHWNLLLFVEKQNTQNLIDVSCHYAMEESPDERGAETLF